MFFFLFKFLFFFPLSNHDSFFSFLRYIYLYGIKGEENKELRKQRSKQVNTKANAEKDI